MTDKDVVTALKYCADINCNCGKCNLFVAGDDDCQCTRKLKLAAVDLIYRTKLESKKYRGKCIRQKKELELMNERIARLKAEIENNRKVIYSFLSIIDEFERAYHHLDEANQKFEKAFEKSKNLVKEMEGDV